MQHSSTFLLPPNDILRVVLPKGSVVIPSPKPLKLASAFSMSLVLPISNTPVVYL
jgi:hypothetical protein